MVAVLSATLDQKSIVANLLELYSYDFSEFVEVRLGADGRFGYKHLDSYWTEPHRFPLLIKSDEELAGFALVKKGSEFSNDADVWDVAEFFIVRAHRRRGVGMNVATEIWKRFPGRWEVRVMQSNVGARKFWERSIANFVGREIVPVLLEKDEKSWLLFSFES